MKLSDSLLGVLFVAFGAFVLYNASLLPPVRHIDFGPGFLPAIVAAGMMLCGALLVVRDVRTHRRFVVSAEFTEWATTPGGPAKLVTVLVALLLFPVLVSTFGFLLSTICFLFVLLLAGGIQVPIAATVAVGGAVFSQLVFVELLRVPLPWGVLVEVSPYLSFR